MRSMTKQNHIHKYVCSSEKYRKELHKSISGHKIPHHNRNYWKAWWRRFCKEYNHDKTELYS